MTRQEWLNALKKGDAVEVQYLTGEVRDAVVHSTTDFTVSVTFKDNPRSYPFSKKQLGFISAMFPVESFLNPKSKTQKITSTAEEQLRFNLKILLSKENIPSDTTSAMIVVLKSINFWQKPSQFRNKLQKKGT